MATAELGLSAFQFGTWTPQELSLALKGKKEQQKDHYESLKYVVANAVQAAFTGKDRPLFEESQDEKRIDPDEKKEELSSLYKDFGMVVK